MPGPFDLTALCPYDHHGKGQIAPVEAAIVCHRHIIANPELRFAIAIADMNMARL